MSTSKKCNQLMGFLYYFTDKVSSRGVINGFTILCLGLMLNLIAVFCLSAACMAKNASEVNFPVDMQSLIASLSKVRSESQAIISYPHKIEYRHVTYDTLNDELKEEKRSLVIRSKPKEIIPQSVGITEILWAICPRNRIIAYHEACRNPQFSFLADKIPPSGPFFGTQDAEIVIGYDPDLVLITYYTSAEFKERLKSSAVKFVETGYFGDIASLEKQILLIGELIGEQANARLLIDKMQKYIRGIKAYVGQDTDRKEIRVLYYDQQGYVAGLNTTFHSMCQALDLVNVPSVHNVRYFEQVEYEQILKWNPDVIIVPEESNLKQQLYSEKILQTSKAVKNKKIKNIPSVYLYASSQYMVASLNYLAGILYAK